jgi:hypothetical protein
MPRIRLLSSRRRVALFITTIAILIAGGILALAAAEAQEREKTVKASSILHVARVRPSVMKPPQAEETERDFEIYKRTQAVLVKSRLVLNSALRDPRVSELPVVANQADPVAWLQEMVEVTFPDNGEIMHIELRGANAADAFKLASAVTDAYLREIVNKEKLERSKRLEMLQAILTQYDNMLRNKRSALRTLQEQAGLVKSEKEKFAEEFLGDVGKAIREAGLAKIDLRAQVNRLNAVKDPTPEQKQLVEKLEEQIALQTEREKLLGERFTRLADEVKQARVKYVDLESFKEEIAQAEATAKKVQAEVESMRIESNAPTRINLLDPPSVSRPK